MTDEASEQDALFRKTISKKRGRPRLLLPEHEEIVNGFATQATSRGKQNHYYGMLGLAALPEPKDDPRFAWLWSGEKARMTILSELGRFEEKETILQLALEICERKMATREAVRLLREYRGVRLPATENQAANVICTTINDYVRSHPDVTIEKLIVAVRIVLHILEEQRAASNQQMVA